MADLSSIRADAQKLPASLREAAELLSLSCEALRDLVLRDRAPLTIKDAAAALGVSVQTIYNLAEREEMPISKILGKSVVFRDDYDQYIEKARGAYRKGGR